MINHFHFRNITLDIRRDIFNRGEPVLKPVFDHSKNKTRSGFGPWIPGSEKSWSHFISDRYHHRMNGIALWIMATFNIEIEAIGGQFMKWHGKATMALWARDRRISPISAICRIPTVKLKIPGKHFWNPKPELLFFHKYFSQFFHGSVLAKSQPLPLVDS